MNTKLCFALIESIKSLFLLVFRNFLHQLGFSQSIDFPFVNAKINGVEELKYFRRIISFAEVSFNPTLAMIVSGKKFPVAKGFDV